MAGLSVPSGGCGRSAPAVDPSTAKDAEDDAAPLRIASSRSALPLVEMLVGEAAALNPDFEAVYLATVHSGEAAAAVHEGRADVGFLSRPRTEAERDYGLSYLHVARDPLVFATHAGVRVSDLTTDQVRGIYSGAITDWSQVGGKDQKIVVLDRPEPTAPKLALRPTVFGESLTITDDAVVLEEPRTMRTELESTPGAIGYLGLGDLLCHDLAVNVLSLDGIPPTPEKLQQNRYAFGLPIGMVMKPKPRKVVMTFLDFVASVRGREVLAGNGFSYMEMHLAIATIPERNVVRQLSRYQPLIDYLSAQLDEKVNVELRPLASYEDVVQKFVDGQVNAAFFGSYTYVATRAKVGVEPLVRPEKDSVSTYRGLIFARKDREITTWADLEGRSFAMILDTTAGELFPKVYLKRHGIDDVERFLGRIDYTGNHDVAILKVLNGEVDAGAAKDLVFHELAKEDPRIAEELVILATSDPVPENALVVRENIDVVCYRCHRLQSTDRSGAPGKGRMDLKERLRRALLSLEETPRGRDVLMSFGADRFVATEDSDYRRVYEMVHELGLDLGRKK